MGISKRVRYTLASAAKRPDYVDVASAIRPEYVLADNGARSVELAHQLYNGLTYGDPILGPHIDDPNTNGAQIAIAFWAKQDFYPNGLAWTESPLDIWCPAGGGILLQLTTDLGQYRASWGYNYSGNTWQHYVGFYTPSEGKLQCYTNGTLFPYGGDYPINAEGQVVAAVSDDTSLDNGGDINPSTYMCCCGVWKWAYADALGETARATFATDLYDSGNEIYFDDLDTADHYTDDLIHWWNFNEESDGSVPVTRSDSVGSAHWTDNKYIAGTYYCKSSTDNP